MADLVRRLDRAHRDFAESHNDWCEDLEHISPASPDFAARVADGWDRRGLGDKFREVEELIRRMALEVPR